MFNIIVSDLRLKTLRYSECKINNQIFINVHVINCINTFCLLFTYEIQNGF